MYLGIVPIDGTLCPPSGGGAMPPTVVGGKCIGLVGLCYCLHHDPYFFCRSKKLGFSVVPRYVESFVEGRCLYECLD